jgi:hypothetical protein
VPGTLAPEFNDDKRVQSRESLQRPTASKTSAAAALELAATVSPFKTSISLAPPVFGDAMALSPAVCV